MTFKPSTWFPIAVGLSAVNLVAVGFAVGPGEPWHAGIHAALALVFGLWAQRLRQSRGGSGGGEIQERLEALEAEAGRVEALEGDVGKLRQELSEAQERLDFAERLLAQGREKDRVGPQR
jgi:hypothetical protein